METITNERGGKYTEATKNKWQKEKKNNQSANRETEEYIEVLFTL